jgi:hypothetical protein
MTDELKPCPFCGERPKLPHGSGTQYEIECDCGMAQSCVQISDLMTLEERQSGWDDKEMRYADQYVERAKNEAISTWNRRTLAAPSDKQEADGVAVTASGAEYHNPRKAYAEAEEAGCVRMWLDDLGAPIGDDAGTFSLVGRIRAHFANPSDKQEAHEKALADSINRGVGVVKVLYVDPDEHADDHAVDRFAQAMKEKMAAARANGRGGWEQCPPEVLSRMLREHVEKGDPRDVANFCMMLWNIGDAISAPLAQSAEQDRIDAERLVWLSRNLSVDLLNSYTRHVVMRGGDGDLSDIRTFIDSAKGASK